MPVIGWNVSASGFDSSARSKIKSHTLVSRDNFEERIKTIGAFSPQHL